MTLRELLSEETDGYVCELNKKYPNMSSDEFRRLVEEFIEENKEAIALNENNDLDDDYEPLNEGLKDLAILDDEEEEAKPAEDGGEKEPEAKKEPESAEGEKKEKTYSKKTVHGRVTLVDPDGKELSSSSVSTITHGTIGKDYRERVIDGKTWIYVSNDTDKEINIHHVVDQWYKRCLKNGKGQNEMKHTTLELFWTADVEDMSALFAFANVPRADLSTWEVDGVKNMEGMFYRSTYNSASICGWNPCNCVNFRNMFVGSRFAQDISGWETGTVTEDVYDEETGAVKKVTFTDPDTGEEKTETETRERKVALPIVGARVAANETEEDEDIQNRLDSYGVPADDDDDDLDESMLYGRRVMTLDEFVNEGFYDAVKSGIKKGVNSVKKIAKKAIELLVNDFYVVNVNPETGNVVNATDINTTMNYISVRKPKGVTAFSKVKSKLFNKEVSDKAYIEYNGERYGFIKAGSREFDNYIKFLGWDAWKKGGVNEARVPLKAEGSSFNIPDITSEDLDRELDRLILKAPAYTGREKSPALCIFGAPGIGKTTIPSAIIERWNNNNANAKKSLIIIQCGDLELGGFNIPMPEHISLGEVINANKKVKENLIEQGYTADDFERLSKTGTLRTKESPKTWLPVYYKNDEDMNAAQEVANGRRISKMVKDERTGTYKRQFEDTSEGGIIIFDEFLRADEELFKTIGQLVNERTIGHGEYILGEKWSILLCSNRPFDDEEVLDHWEGQSPAMGNRFLGGIYNFIPDFNDWIKWARDKGHFDEDTLNFIQQPETIDGSPNKEVYKIDRRSGEQEVVTYKNWHYVDKEGFESGKTPIVTTPRGWSALMEWVEDEKRITGADSIFGVNFNDLYVKAKGILGIDMAKAYLNYMERQRSLYVKHAKPKMSELFSGKLEKPIDKSLYSCKEAVTDVEKYVETHFTREDIVSGGEEIGKEFLNMALNLDDAYVHGGAIKTELGMLHNNIIQKIFKIHSDKEDLPMIKNLKPYLEFVCEDTTYNASLLPSRNK